MMRSPDVQQLAALFARLDQAHRLLDHVAREGGRPGADWRFLDSRMRDLETRIGAICEDAQVLLLDRLGYSQPKRKVGAA